MIVMGKETFVAPEIMFQVTQFLSNYHFQKTQKLALIEEKLQIFLVFSFFSTKRQMWSTALYDLFVRMCWGQQTADRALPASHSPHLLLICTCSDSEMGPARLSPHFQGGCKVNRPLCPTWQILQTSLIWHGTETMLLKLHFIIGIFQYLTRSSVVTLYHYHIISILTLILTAGPR